MKKEKVSKIKLEQLKEKRKLLQKEIRLKESRSLAAREIKYLEAHNFAFNLFYNHEHVNWMHNNLKVRNKDGYHGSHGDFQIDVNDADAEFTIKVAPDDSSLISKTIREFFNTFIEDAKLIVCTLGGKPELEISKNTFLSKPFVFFSNFENWALCTDKKYVIEYIPSQKVIRCIDITQSEPVLQTKIIINL